MNQLSIVAVIVAKEAFQEDVLKALHAVTDGTRREEGNISYILHQDTTNPLKFVIIENWKSQEAIAHHDKTEHFQAFKNAIADKIDSLSIDILRKIY